MHTPIHRTLKTSFPMKVTRFKTVKGTGEIHLRITRPFNVEDRRRADRLERTERNYCNVLRLITFLIWETVCLDQSISI